MSASQVLSNDFLKGVLSDAMVYRGVLSDFNSTVAGIWQVQEGVTANIPDGIYGYGIMEILVTKNFIVQRYTTHEGGGTQTSRYGVFVRTKYTGQSFTPLRKISFST